jgi:serine protease
VKRSHSRTLPLLLAAVFVAAVLIVQPTAGQAPRGPQAPWLDSFAGHAVAARQVLVKFRARPQAEELRLEVDADRDEEIGGAGVRLLHSRSHETATLLDRFSRRPDVEFAEPDFVVRADQTVPNDPWFGSLWALRNTGQVIQGSPGSFGADIGASLAWDISTGSRTNVVAVVDTGIDYTHPDLAANVWAAPLSFTVTIGGHPVTCAAGTHGFNAITMTCDPRDDNNHGTHVSGTIGAAGNNGLGVVGVNWTASIMAAKFLDANGNGYTSDAINAIEFAVQAKALLGTGANVRVLSNSWGGGGFSQALLDEISRANANEMLFVAAAGNASSNNDTTPSYPASYSAPNVVSVAATDNLDRLASFSNYGPNSVHLGAPGVNILSTVRGGAYAWGSGTSMATPHVSGAAALALSKCSLTTGSLKSALLDNVDRVLGGWTITGGRLDVANALRACTSAPPPDFTLSSTPASQTIYRGATASYSIGVGTQTGFAGSVALIVSGLPAGTTASLSPASVGAPGSSTLTVVTSVSTPTGTFLLTVAGVSGSIIHTLPVTLVVAAQPQADFSITATPPSASVRRGGTAIYTVTVTGQGGFSDQVQLSVTGLPRDATGSFSPAAVIGSGTSTLNVKTGTTRGTFTLTITGTSPSHQHVTQVKLQINR